MTSGFTIQFNLWRWLSAVGTIVGRWKIFEDHGEPGWKAIIPFLNIYTFAKISNQKELGARIVFCNIVAIVASMIFVVMFSMSLANHLSPAEIDAFINSGDLNSTIQVIVNGLREYVDLVPLLIGLVAIFAIIASFVFYIVLHYHFTILQNAPASWILVWIFLPVIGYIYFAFFHNPTNTYDEDNGEF